MVSIILNSFSSIRNGNLKWSGKLHDGQGDNGCSPLGDELSFREPAAVVRGSPRSSVKKTASGALGGGRGGRPSKSSHSFVLNQSGTRSPLTLNSGKRKHSNLMLLFAEAKCSKFELLGLWVIRKPYVSLLLFALFTGKGRMQ